MAAKFRELDVLGVVVIAFVLLAIALMLPACRQKVTDADQQAACMGNLKQIITAMKTYAPDYDEYYPTSATPGEEINVATHYRDLGILYPTYCSALEVFVCPGSSDRMPRGRGWHPSRPEQKVAGANKPFPEDEARQVSYAYSYNGASGRNVPWTDAAPSTTIILADRTAGRLLTRRSNHGTRGRNAAFADGHVKWLPGKGRLLTDQGNPDPAISTKSWWSER